MELHMPEVFPSTRVVSKSEKPTHNVFRTIWGAACTGAPKLLMPFAPLSCFLGMTLKKPQGTHSSLCMGLFIAVVFIGRDTLAK